MSRPKYRDPVPDGPDIVASTIAGYYYECPDIDAVDACLRTLLDVFLSADSNLTVFGRAQWKRDREKLLDHRSWLKIIGAIGEVA